MTSRSEFPTIWDSSMVAALRSCQKKANLGYVEHWKLKGESIHLHAGKAFARGLEVARLCFYEEGFSHDDSVARGGVALMRAYGEMECPEGIAKTADRMLGALVYYFDQWPMHEDQLQPLVLPSGRHAIEFSFAHPLPVAHPVTGDPLIYAGRSDMIATFADGVYIEDDKTASQLGASWSRQWDLRSQFTGYTWAARESRILVNGVIVRGVSILKTRYDKAQAITYRAKWEIDRWLEQTTRDLERAKRAWEEGYWDWALDNACTEYGGCQFNFVCKQEHPETWLPVYFERRVWNPLDRTETPLLEEVAA